MTFLSKVSTLLACLLLTATVQAQSCHDNIKETAPTARYNVLDGGTEIHDTLTNLTWKRCEEGLSGIDCSVGSRTWHTWADALGLSDTRWRLPNIKELASLVERACDAPTINLTVFPNATAGGVWSSSPYVYDYDAWFVFFAYGSIRPETKTTNLAIRLVRSGQ